MCGYICALLYNNDDVSSRWIYIPYLNNISYSQILRSKDKTHHIYIYIYIYIYYI